MFKNVLVASRADGAVRIIRTLRELGIKVYAIYVEGDETSRHVGKADEAFQVSSYTDIKEIVSLAKKLEIQAIHPGWGFSSEDPKFSRACRRANITFIGPSEDTMKLCSDKMQARSSARKAGVPVITGTPKQIKKSKVHEWTAAHGLSDEPDSVPFMIKLAAGEGGGGNARVYRLQDLDAVIEEVTGNSGRKWRSKKFYCERLMMDVRHIEVQVMRDSKGKCITMGTRDCSVQWKDAKMVEIAPAPNLSEEQVTHLYKYAKAIFEELDYCGIGTIEYLVDLDGKAYFLEVNPRLQVEHGVTELITGCDLVQMQLQIACGEGIPISQDDVKIQGFAVEARINALKIDPQYPTTLMVSTGIVEEFKLPKGGNVRVDHNFVEGCPFNLDFDVTQGKVLAKGDTYRRAIANLRSALERMVIKGVETNIPLLLRILNDQEFREARHITSFLPALLERMSEIDDTEDQGRKDTELATSETKAGDANIGNREMAAIVGVAIAAALAKQRSSASSRWQTVGRRERIAPFRRW